MCAIAGIAGFRDDKLLKKFSEELKHRGPDGEGFYRSPNVSLLNRRLAIIDVKGGKQPIFNEDKSIVVVYNGEIYNYRELRAQLEKAGHKFKTKSDTEVIVHGYEVWGDDCFDRFNGMFAIAIYDIHKKRLVLARDHFGIKPLYYTMTEGNKILFSSEIKPLIYSGLVAKKPNDRVIYRYLRYRIHDDTEETFFAGVSKLMPGEMMILQGTEITRKYFSKLEDELKNTRAGFRLHQPQIAEFSAQLKNAIRMRLISEVPVGTCLSGGLDSSTIAASVNAMLKDNVREAQSVGTSQNTFSAVFPGSKNDEERYIDEFLNQNKDITSHKVYPKPEEFFDEIQDFVRTQEEPTISTGPYAQYKVMQAAQKHVKVLLDGQGADELMAGYLPYYFVYLRQLKNTKKRSKLIREVVGSRDILFKYFKLKIRGWRSTISPSSLMNPAFRKKFKSESFIVEKNNLKRRLLADVFYHSLPALLRYEDKNAMRFSIEGRVPFLDFNLVRALFAMPDEAIIKNGWNKYVLRKSVAKMLPASIVKRRNKVGFTTPEEEWFIRMKNRIYSLFLSESFASRPYFDQTAVVNAFRTYIEGKTDDSMMFWRMLNIEIWHRVFFDTPTLKTEAELQSSRTTMLTIGETISKPFEANAKQYERLLVKTDVFEKNDDYGRKIASYINYKLLRENKKWYVVVSEKIVAISQGRSYFIWDIHPNIVARTLSRFVTRTPYGIGLGSPWTMQLALEEVGFTRIMLASLVAVVTKPFKIKGMFYRVAGREAAAIDGPTEYSLFPSNVSAKLAPRDPHAAAEAIDVAVEERLKQTKSLRNFRDTFGGAVVIDANDIGRNVLGNSTEFDDKYIENIFADNPMGQGTEQTPVTIVIEK